MRDPKRIERILKKLKKVWKAKPDWRLGQLIINAMSEESGSGFFMRPSRQEIFSFEDDKMEKRLEDLL
jgi:uncharacterized protein YihD (DUF1040 family)